MFDSLDNPVGVVCGFCTLSQGALRDPGLSWKTTSWFLHPFPGCAARPWAILENHFVVKKKLDCFFRHFQFQRFIHDLFAFDQSVTDVNDAITVASCLGIVGDHDHRTLAQFR